MYKPIHVEGHVLFPGSNHIETLCIFDRLGGHTSTESSERSKSEITSIMVGKNMSSDNRSNLASTQRDIESENNKNERKTKRKKKNKKKKNKKK